MKMMVKYLVLLTVLLALDSIKVKGQGSGYDQKVGEKAREAPYCINPGDPNLDRNGNFKEWKGILQKNPPPFKSQNLRFGPTPTKGLQYLQWVHFSKIKLIGDKYVKDKNLKYLKDDTILAGSTEFRQWFHIMIKASVPLEGLYVQAIHGPIGIPFGQFDGFEFLSKEKKAMRRSKCVNCDKTVDGFVAFPCSGRSKANLQHPNVYLFHHRHVGLNGESAGKATEIHMNYNYVDVICNRVTSLQFLIIAVQSFGSKKFEVVKTQVFKFSRTTNFDGVPYPFYADFDGYLTCGESSGGNAVDPAFKILDESNPTAPDEDIRYNIEYDECIRSRTDFSEVCNPGPFQCKQNEISATDEETIYKTLDKDPACECDKEQYDSGPEEDVTDFPDDIANEGGATHFDPSIQEIMVETTTSEPKNKTEDSEEEQFLKSIFLIQFTGPDQEADASHRNRFSTGGLAWKVKEYHGKLMFAALCIFLSIGTFSSRFFKETSIESQCGGKGLWLWCHIFFTFLSFVTLWSGVVFTILIKPRPGSDSSAHISIGIIAIILFHFNLLSGWFRPVDKRLRFIYITMHLVCGYGTKFFALIAMFVSSVLISYSFWVILLLLIITEVLNIIFYAVGTFVMCAVDTKTLTNKTHKVCPVPEQRETVQETKLSCCLGILLPIHLLLQLGLLVVAILFWHPPIIRAYDKIVGPIFN